jgi:hypothetical protein
MEYGSQILNMNWYEKDPNNVTTEEFKKLVEDFDDKLSNLVKSGSITIPVGSIIFTKDM